MASRIGTSGMGRAARYRRSARQASRASAADRVRHARERSRSRTERIQASALAGADERRVVGVPPRLAAARRVPRHDRVGDALAQRRLAAHAARARSP